MSSVFHCNNPGDWLQNFKGGLGFIQQAGWHWRQIGAIGPVMKRDFLPQKTFCWWIQAVTEPVGNVINEQLSAHFKVHACCCTWTLTKQQKFLSGLILLKAFKSSSLSVGWWIVKECALFLVQGRLHYSLLELLLACQSHCVHIHVAMSSSFIQGVRGSSDTLLELRYLVEPGHGCDTFHSLFSQAGRRAGRWAAVVTKEEDIRT